MNEEHFPRKSDHDGFFCRFTFGQFFALLLLEVFTLFFIFYLGARYGGEFFQLSSVSQSPQITVIQKENPESRDSTLVGSEDPAAQAMADELIAKAGTPELKEKIAEMLKGQPTDATRSNLGEGVIVVGNPPGQNSAQAPMITEATPQQVAQETAAPSNKVMVITADGESKTLDEASAYQHLAAVQANSNAQAPAQAATTPPQNAEAVPPVTALEPQGAVKVKNSATANYSIQVGSYPQLEEANQAIANWKTKGYPAYMMIADIPDKGRWYRVRLGSFAEKTQAEAYLTELASREKVDAFVTTNE